jgi:hypothetical protein
MTAPEDLTNAFSKKLELRRDGDPILQVTGTSASLSLMGIHGEAGV